MEEVDIEVLKQTVAKTVALHKKSFPNSFYDAGGIVTSYFIFLEAKVEKAKPKKKTSITASVIQRELEKLFASGDLSVDYSWLDPRAIKQREDRAKELEKRHRDGDA